MVGRISDARMNEIATSIGAIRDKTAAWPTEEYWRVIDELFVEAVQAQSSENRMRCDIGAMLKERDRLQARLDAIAHKMLEEFEEK